MKRRVFPAVAALTLCGIFLLLTFGTGKSPAGRGDSRTGAPVSRSAQTLTIPAGTGENGGNPADSTSADATDSGTDEGRSRPAPPRLVKIASGRTVLTPALDVPVSFPADITSGGKVSFKLPDGREASGTVTYQEGPEDAPTLVQGPITSPQRGWFYFQSQPPRDHTPPLTGRAYFEGEKIAFRIDCDGPDKAVLAQHPMEDVMCMAPPAPADVLAANAAEQAAAEEIDLPQDHPIDIPIPHWQNGILPLESLPGAAGVLYLDMDGETGPWPGWPEAALVSLPHSGWTPSAVRRVWQRIAEDFAPFTVNVTTDLSVYLRAPENSRIRCIFSANPWSSSWGGIAYLGSYNNTGNQVCWVAYSGSSGAAVASHELGHTLWLYHDGRTDETYYRGHGSGTVSWGPIMGSAGYYVNLDTWSRGEYADANNQEDDRSIIIGSNNNVDNREDEAGDTLADARWLDIRPGGAVTGEGLIGRSSDIDAWRFTTRGGPCTFTVTPVSVHPNVDLSLEVLNAAGGVVGSDNPDLELGASLSVNLAAGEYWLRIDGVGRGNVLGSGYSDYASLGMYTITGTAPAAVTARYLALQENRPAGTALGTVTGFLAHAPGNASWAITAGNELGLFTIDAATGMLSALQSVNYEAMSSGWNVPARVELTVSITDTSAPGLDETVRAVVEITDANEAPQFTLTAAEIPVYANTAIGTELPVSVASASDPDQLDQPASWSLTAGNTGGAFRIDASGRLFVAGAITETSYQLTVRVADSGTPTQTASRQLSVRVLPAPAGHIPRGPRRSIWNALTDPTVTGLRLEAIARGPDEERLLDAWRADGRGDDYGDRTRGWFLAPETGTYTFWLSGNDEAELFLGTTSGSAANPVRAARTITGTLPEEWDKTTAQRSAPVLLTAGEPWYIETFHAEGTGTDHLAVAVTGPGIPSRMLLPGAWVAPYLENDPPSLPPAAFRVRGSAVRFTTVGMVTWNDVNKGATPAFEIVSGNTGGAFGIEAATGRLYVDAPAALSSGGQWNLTVRITDGGIPPLSAEGPVTVDVTPPTDPGVLTVEIWDRITTNSVTALLNNARYPLKPDRLFTLSTLTQNTVPGDSYGGRLRALLVPPVTGDYRLYIAADDHARLLMSTGESPAGAAQIASVGNYTGFQSWTESATQASAVRRLTAGARYYIEVLHKESDGVDHFSVGWSGPGITGIVPVPAEAVLPFDINAAPVWDAAAYTFEVPDSSGAGATAGRVVALDSPSDNVVYAIAGGNTGGVYRIDPWSGVITLTNPAALPPAGQSLLLTVTASDNGMGGTWPPRTSQTTVTIRTASSAIRSPVSSEIMLHTGHGLVLNARLPESGGEETATALWEKLSGPGTITFSPADSAVTAATFSLPGSYQIRFTGTVGVLTETDTLTVHHDRYSGAPYIGSRIGTYVSTPQFEQASTSWTIDGDGDTIASNGTADSFHYVYRPLAGDLRFTARVVSVSNVDGTNSRAGIMLRENATVGARHMFAGMTALNGLRQIYRTTAGATSGNTAIDDVPGPRWFRLTRAGSTLFSESAPDDGGQAGNWTPLGTPQSIAMARVVLVGFAACSGTAATQNDVVIDNVEIESAINIAPWIELRPATVPFYYENVLQGAGDDIDKGPLPVLSWEWSVSPPPGGGSGEISAPFSASTLLRFTRPGDYPMRLMVSDGDATSVDFWTAAARFDTPFTLWQAARFPAPDTALAAPQLDPDGDGAPNLVEFASGSDPRSAASAPGLTAALRDGRLVLTHRRHRSASDVIWSVERSEDLQNWTAVDTVVTITPSPDLLDTAEASVAPGPTPSAAFRLRATLR